MSFFEVLSSKWCIFHFFCFFFQDICLFSLELTFVKVLVHFSFFLFFFFKIFIKDFCKIRARKTLELDNCVLHSF